MNRARSIPRLLGPALLVLVASGTLAVDEPVQSARPESVQDGWLERRWATTDLTALAVALVAWRQEHGSWPADCPGEAASLLNPAPKADPWGTPYACRLDDPPRVASNGPDLAAGTADDLEYRLDGKGLIPPAGAPVQPGTSAELPSSPAAPATDEAKSTTDRLVWLGRALEAYRQREGRYPVAEKAEYLENWLVPADLPPSQWEGQDGWGRPWRYRVTDTGSSYSLSSGGADGRWEPITPPTPRAALNADGDLVIADGSFLRWPAGFKPDRVAGAMRPTAPAAEEREPRDPLEATRWRLERLAAVLDRARSAGNLVESDDAPRTFEELGSKLGTNDAWGHEIELLTLGAGRRYVLVSRGPDGRQSLSTEDYARGAAAGGDDIVIRK